MITLTVSLISYYTFLNLVLWTDFIQGDKNSLMHLNQIEEENHTKIQPQVSNSGKFTMWLYQFYTKNKLSNRFTTTQTSTESYHVDKLVSSVEILPTVHRPSYGNNMKAKSERHLGLIKKINIEPYNQFNFFSQSKNGEEENVYGRNTPHKRNKRDSNENTTNQPDFTTGGGNCKSTKSITVPQTKLSRKEIIVKSILPFSNSTVSMIVTPTSTYFTITTTNKMYNKQGVAPRHKLSAINKLPGQDEKGKSFTTKTVYRQFSINYDVGKLKSLKEERSTTVANQGKKYRPNSTGIARLNKTNNRITTGSLVNPTIATIKLAMAQTSKQISLTQRHNKQLLGKKNLSIFTSKHSKSSNGRESGGQYHASNEYKRYRVENIVDFSTKINKLPKIQHLVEVNKKPLANQSRSPNMRRDYLTGGVSRSTQESPTEQNRRTQLMDIRRGLSRFTPQLVQNRIPGINSKARFTTKQIPLQPRFSSKLHRQFKVYRLRTSKNTSSSKTSHASNNSQSQLKTAALGQNNKFNLTRKKRVYLRKNAKITSSSRTNQGSNKSHNQLKIIAPVKRLKRTKVSLIEQSSRPPFTSRRIPSFKYSSNQISKSTEQKTTSHFWLGSRIRKGSISSKTTTNSPKVARRKKLANKFSSRISGTQDLTEATSAEKALNQLESFTKRAATLAKSEHSKSTIKNRWISRKPDSLPYRRSESMPKGQKTMHGTQSRNENGINSSSVKIKQRSSKTDNTVQRKFLNHEIVISQYASEEEVEPLWHRMFSEAAEINATDTYEGSVTTSSSRDTVPSTVAYSTTIEKVVLEFTPNIEIITVNTTKLSPLYNTTRTTTANIIDNSARSQLTVHAFVNNTSTLTPLYVKEKARLEEYNHESLFARILRIFDKKTSYQYYGFTVSVRLEGRTVSSGCIINEETVLTVLETSPKVKDEVVIVQTLNSMQFSTRVGQQQESEIEDVVKLVPLFNSHTVRVTGSMVFLMKVQHLFEFGNSIYPAIINTTGIKGKPLVVAEWQRVSHGNDMDIPVTLLHYSVSISTKCGRLFGKHAAKHMICVRRPFKNDSNYCGRLGSLLVQRKTNNVLGILTHPNCNSTAGFTPLRNIRKWINETVQSR